MLPILLVESDSQLLRTFYGQITYKLFANLEDNLRQLCRFEALKFETLNQPQLEQM
jgi:hypothetical protein